MNSFNFNYKDIFKSNRLAFSLQRIWIQFLGVAIGYAGYLVFTYLSLVVSGNQLLKVWQQMGLFPCIHGFGYKINIVSWILYGIGFTFLIVFYLISSTAVARAVYMTLKGNHFYSWREAFNFAFKKLTSFICAPIAIFILIGLFVLGGIAVGLLGKIPFIGELGISIFYLLWLIAGLFIVLFICVLVVSLILSPSIIATTDDDAFEAVFQSFSTLWSQPWRFIVYEILTSTLAVVGFTVFAFIAKRGFLIINTIFLSTVGDKYSNLMINGLYLLSNWVSVSITWLKSFLGDSASYIYFSNTFLQLELPTILSISSYIFAIMVLIFGGFIVSYGLAVFNVGNTITFLILRQKKDGENLLERHDREEDDDDEEVNDNEADKDDKESDNSQVDNNEK